MQLKIMGLTFLLVTPSLTSPTVKLSILTGNCYAFPPTTRNVLKDVSGFFDSEIDLVGGIDKSIGTRINEIAALVKKKNPDVVVFQELWGNDNKQQMSRRLRDQYPHIYWISQTTEQAFKDVGSSIGNFLKTAFTSPQKLGDKQTYVALNPVKMDSGLFIASKFEFNYKGAITYEDKGGDEVNAKKGALVVLLHDRTKKPVLLAVTHLQSWRDAQYVRIREKQMRQLANFLANKKVKVSFPKANMSLDIKLTDFPRLSTVIIGDFNNPITYQEAPKRLIDRSNYLVKTLQEEGIKVSNDAVLAILKERYGIQEYVEVRELKKDAIVTQFLPSGPQQTVVSETDVKNPLYPFIGRFYEKKENKELYDYWAEASDPRGTQLLDQIFLSPNCGISSYSVLRKEVLGDAGKSQPYNKKTAISDHAHLMVEISEKKP